MTSEELIELPEPPKPGLTSYIKALGPGVILSSLAIGGGEWILFPAAVVKYGPYLMWAATVSCIVQAVLAVESIKYTIYCGQPIHQAYQKIGNKPLFWSWLWTLLLFIPVMWPAWALASSTAVVALQLGRLPGPGDADLILLWGIIALVVGILVLHIGRKIQRTLEILSWIVIVAMFSTLIIAVILATPGSAWIDVGKGIFSFGFPKGADWFMLSAAIAYIPAGFGFNLMLSSYARDKGWGMGSKVGYISSFIGGKKVKLSTDEMPFTINEENLRRWKGWLNIARIDSWIVFSLLTFITVYITSVMAYSILVPRGLAPVGFKVAAVQAEALKEVVGPIGWILILLGGFWILFDTQWGLMDATTRVIMDNFWISSEKIRRWAKEDPRRLYYSILYIIFVVALILMICSVKLGWAQPYEVLALGANLGLFALFIAYPLQIIVNHKYLPKELKPTMLTTFLLIVGMIFYGFFLLALLLQTFTGIRI